MGVQVIIIYTRGRRFRCLHWGNIYGRVEWVVLLMKLTKWLGEVPLREMWWKRQSDN